LISLEWQLIILTLAGRSRRKESLQCAILLVHLLLVLNSLIVCRLYLARTISHLRYLLITSESELLLLCSSLLPEFLLVIVVFEVIIKSRGRSEALEDRQHSLASFGVDLLAVPALASWLVLVEWIFDMDELSVWNVLDVDPLNFERAWPFSWLLPQVRVVLFVVDSLDHLCDSTEMFGLVHTV